MRPLNARPGRVPRSELLGRLLAAGPLQRLVLLTRLQPDDPRLLLRLRALRPRRTRRAILAGEPRLVNHAVLWIRVGEPGDALFARWQVTTCGSQSTTKLPLSKPSPARACQLGSSATGPTMATPYSRWLSTRTWASV